MVPGTRPQLLGGRVQDHPCGARSVAQAPSLSWTLKCRLWANKARFHLIFYKVSQNGGVSPVYVEKACHSPCFQNGCQSSPLGILRFPFRLAFSHKELMGHIRPWARVNGQNDEVSPDVHTTVHAKGSPDTPTHHAASCLCGALLIWLSAGNTLTFSINADLLGN